MFADALELAMQFTFPIVLSRMQHNGQCSASIGAFVIVNRDGWIVTAAHIVEDLIALDRQVSEVHQITGDRAAIDADTSLSGGEKRRRIAKLPKINPKANERYSALWSWSGVTISNLHFIGGVDIAIGQLVGFDPALVTVYPKFKDPSRNVRPGTGLCRLGYPFHQFTPIFDPATNMFSFPAEAIPIPIFASEGIIARFYDVRVDGLAALPPFPLRWIETSSPGLKGQSGGPLFDENAVVWGIQSNTFSYSLGFSPSVSKANPNQKEHQFLNAGRAVHPDTMVGMLREQGIAIELSDY